MSELLHELNLLHEQLQVILVPEQLLLQVLHCNHLAVTAAFWGVPAACTTVQDEVPGPTLEGISWLQATPVAVMDTAAGSWFVSLHGGSDTGDSILLCSVLHTATAVSWYGLTSVAPMLTTPGAPSRKHLHQAL